MRENDYRFACETPVCFTILGQRYVSDVQMMKYLDDGYLYGGWAKVKEMVGVAVQCGRMLPPEMWRFGPWRGGTVSRCTSSDTRAGSDGASVVRSDR